MINHFHINISMCLFIIKLKLFLIRNHISEITVIYIMYSLTFVISSNTTFSFIYSHEKI